jgi:hypothetical protein
MLARLRSGERSAQGVEFYLHELKASAAFRRWGDLSSAHRDALQWRGVTERDLFHIDVIKANPSAFNSSWLK